MYHIYKFEEEMKTHSNIVAKLFKLEKSDINVNFQFISCSFILLLSDYSYIHIASRSVCVGFNSGLETSLLH